MKHVVWKAYMNYEKEEKYLNEMSSKGLALTSYTWCRYVFEDAPAGEYIYRIELLENSITHPESQQYIKFMEETGAEFVASYMRWVYFRKKAEDGEFDIYSDLDSKINHYKRVVGLFAALMVANLAIGISNLFIGIRHLMNNYNLPNFYLSFLNLAIGVLFFFALYVPYTKRIRSLKREKNIHE